MPRTTARTSSAPAARAPAAKKAKLNDAPLAAPESIPPASIEEFEALLQVEHPGDRFSERVELSGLDKTDTDSLAPGMLLCRPARLVVMSANGGQCEVRNQDIHAVRNGEGDWSLSNQLVQTQCWNADQYTEVRQENMSTIASLLRDQVGDVICKVEFTKEPNPVDMADLLQRGAGMIEQLFTTPTEKKRQYKRLFERSKQGEYRIMRGYILRDADMSTKETDTGMIRFLDADLMAEGKFAERQINLRNLRALTFKLIRYERKA